MFPDRASAVGLAERPQVAGSLPDEVLARQARWHLRAASRKTASPSAADVFPHCVRFALMDLVQLMFDNVSDADDAAEPAVLLDYRNVADPMRLQLVGLGSDSGFACPLNQYLLADALGLTAIHVNRVLRQLRERCLVTFRDGRVEFHDLKSLRDLADYHSGYLDQSNGLGL